MILIRRLMRSRPRLRHRRMINRRNREVAVERCSLPWLYGLHCGLSYSEVGGLRVMYHNGGGGLFGIELVGCGQGDTDGLLCG